MATIKVCYRCRQEKRELVPVWPEPQTPENVEICHECVNTLTDLIRQWLRLEVPA